jgi:subtilase family protein/GEVED domain-containing protein/type IX secretion system substrate protein
MNMKRNKFVPLAFIILSISFSQVQAQLTTNTTVLQRAGLLRAQEDKAAYQKLVTLARQKGWRFTRKGNNGSTILLVGVDVRGFPIYFTTNDNIISAATIRTNQIQPGGSTGLNLSGSSSNMKTKLAIWDGGKVRGTHVELAGRVVQKDGATTLDDHATHTSGTLIASGVNPVAKGMSFGALELQAYDFNNDVAEMLTASTGLLVSNHSYGAIAGWNFNSDVTPNRWEFNGNPGDSVDYRFGYYDDETQMWDSIAYNAPYYLIVKSAGNSHEDGDAVPVGTVYWRPDANGVMQNAGKRTAGTISSDDGFDNLPTYSVAKNILTVGAVNPIPGGYLQSSDAQIAYFSSWGPADDGRIKPDVVADGVNVLSSWGSADNAYQVASGTSMSSPATAGSVFLLQEYYSKLHGGNFMRAATLKGIIIHTADEAGPAPGPDYIYGWGLVNMQKAASVITSDTMANKPDQKIYENNLVNGTSYTLSVTASGKGPLTATISWTDPKATVDEVNIVNNPTRKLVNDLDLRISDGTTTYLPWTLDRKNPSNPAVAGDDSLNNVEKIVINNAVPGHTYTITITHKRTLQRGQQAYSLILSGIGGQAYCTSAPASSAGTRIDSVTFSNIQNPNPAGCTTYTNYTNLTAQIHRDQVVPISIKLSSCDATIAAKMVKVYIDYNNDGVFDPVNELVAQSGVINGNGVFNGTITAPSNLIDGNYTTMRIVAEETTDPSTILPCGTYGKGETQDYRLQIINNIQDFGVSQIIAPLGASCAADSQLVTVLITNYGSVPQINIPVSATISSGGDTIANLNFTYPDTIAAYTRVAYTFQGTFKAVAGNTYTITSRTNFPGDQDTTNDQSSGTFVASTGSTTPTGIAELCGSSEVFFKSTVADTTNVAFWYQTPTATTALAIGNNASTNVITSDHTYYLGLNDQSLTVGPANKLIYPSGGYNNFNGNFVAFSNKVPLTIASARLYIGSAGTITFIVADTSDYNITDGSFDYLTLSSNTINVYPTTPVTPALGTIINTALDTGAVYALNLDVPETGNHVIIVECNDGASIFRNNALTSNHYPYNSAGNLFSITGNSAIMASTPLLYQQYYYFFYDMKLQLDNCATAARVPVVASAPTPPVISIAGNILTSSPELNYQWNFNGSPIVGETEQTDTAIGAGVYTVVATDSLGCSQTSNAITFTGNGAGDISLKVYPNPNSGQFTLQFATSNSADLNITMSNTLGQKVYQSETISGFTGIYNKQLSVDNLSSGMYYLKILLGKKTYVQKILIKR